ncbi:outer membrane immunogenic protein [Bradyrhizobium sp. Rc2d]|nr:outer membrane immunogenic protein [Bradyrhizobium sp. Rc2d]
MVPPIYDWSGLYLGLNGGGGSAHKCLDVINAGGVVVAPPLAMGCHDATGGTAGGQIGYRWQTANWVFGVEAQGNWADFKGSNINLVFAGVQDETKIDAFGLFTGQVGYAWNNVLLYVKGGAAVVRDKYRIVDVATGLTINDGDETRWGALWGRALNSASRRTGPSASNTTTCSWGTGMWTSSRRELWVLRRALLRGPPALVRTSISVWCV